MHAEFEIANGQVKFDVKNGDGSKCQGLAELFATLGEVEEDGTYPEFFETDRVAVSGQRRLA